VSEKEEEGGELSNEERLKQVSGELEGVIGKAFGKAFPGRSRRPLYYKLDEKKRVVPATLYEFGLQFEDPERYRRVGLTKIGPYVVSTVFLCIDHGYKRPAFFETMIWSEKTAEHKFASFQERYETFEEALKGHGVAVRLVEEGALP
jgi:hypothetical protein